MKSYSLKNIFKIALGIEEKGKNFYENLSDYIKKKDFTEFVFVCGERGIKTYKKIL